jgi:molybdate transport system substrate-binding protein
VLRRLALPLAVLALASPACGGADGGDAVTITVGAAASLTAAFEEIGAAFTAANPDVTVQFSFGASSDVARQIGEGAPIEVFASADTKNMDKVVAGAGVSGEPAVFATNSLQVIVAAGNPKRITGIDDLARADLLVVTCSPEVPIGRYTQQVLEAVGVTVEPVSLEENVKGIVSKVTLGEADAGVVYRTDVLAAGDAATGVDIPDDVNVKAAYPIVALKGASPAAVDFVAFVLSDAGQAVLQRFGFGAP